MFQGLDISLKKSLDPWQSNLMAAVGNVDQIKGNIVSFLVVTVSLGSLCNVIYLKV